MSTIGRNRFRPARGRGQQPGGVVRAGDAADGNSRPLVVPRSRGRSERAAAEFDSDAMAEGPVGTILGRPWYVDNNIPLTFGGGDHQPVHVDHLGRPHLAD